MRARDVIDEMAEYLLPGEKTYKLSKPEVEAIYPSRRRPTMSIGCSVTVTFNDGRRQRFTKEAETPDMPDSAFGEQGFLLSRYPKKYKATVEKLVAEVLRDAWDWAKAHDYPHQDLEDKIEEVTVPEEFWDTEMSEYDPNFWERLLPLVQGFRYMREWAGYDEHVSRRGLLFMRLFRPGDRLVRLRSNNEDDISSVFFLLGPEEHLQFRQAVTTVMRGFLKQAMARKEEGDEEP